MKTLEKEAIHLTGIALKHQTTNANGQSATDCGKLWAEFEKGDYAAKTPGKINDAVFAVYYDYVGDYTQPYRFFIGCKVQEGTAVPQGMDSLVIPPGTYTNIPVKGKVPEAVGEAWQNIWKSDLPRAYRPDFEVYDGKDQVEIFLSVKA